MKIENTRFEKIINVQIFDLDISPVQLTNLKSRLDENNMEYAIHLNDQLVVFDDFHNVNCVNGILEDLKIQTLGTKKDTWKIVTRKTITGEERSQRVPFFE